MLVSAVAYYLLGRLWYGPLFGGTWSALVHPPPAATASDPVPLIVAAAVSLVLAYVTAIALAARDDRTAGDGARFGLLMGLGLVAATMLEYYLYEGLPVTLWLINAGYVVVGLVMVGAIVGGWKRSDVL